MNSGHYPQNFGAFVALQSIETTYDRNGVPKDVQTSGGSTYSRRSADGRSFYWYATQDAGEQLNQSGVNYTYIALG